MYFGHFLPWIHECINNFYQTTTLDSGCTIILKNCYSKAIRAKLCSLVNGPDILSMLAWHFDTSFWNMLSENDALS